MAGAVNGIVVLKPCQCGPIDQKTYPHNHENLRGMVDVYGEWILLLSIALLMLSLSLCYAVYRSDYARICHPKGNADGTHGQDVEAIIGGSLTRKEHLDV
jgi:hypothetical protein